MRLLLCVLCVFLSLATVSCAASPPLPVAAAPCGIGSYDFSSLMSKSDWVGLDDNYSEIYYLALCSTVKNLWCTLNSNTRGVQGCQVNAGDPASTFSVMGGNASQTSWTYTNQKNASGGITFTSATGEGSGGCPDGKPRTTIGNLVCGNTTGVISRITENPTCTYTMLLPTSMLCTSADTPVHTVTPDTINRINSMIRNKKHNKQIN